MPLKYFKGTLLLLTLIINFNSLAQQLAFPTASGAGAYATGGRGYGVFKVTNLNNDGPGSLRQAVYDADSNGGGNVVFTVSGAINLTSNLGWGSIQNVSIWGQTAPDGGISVANKLTGFYAGNSQTEPSANIIIRFMRFRVDSSPLINSQYNGIETDVFVMEYANNYIIDHCSFSFGTDEAINHGNGENVTWQHNLIAENSKAMIMGQVAQQQGNFSFNNNLFTRTSHRFVNVESGGRVDLINNYIFDWYSSSAAPRGGFQLNHMNNYFGPNGGDNNIDLDWRGFNYVQESWTPSIHASGNIYENVFEDPNADNIGNSSNNSDGFWRIRTSFGNNGGIIPASWRAATPYTLLGEPFTVRTAAEVKAQLPDNAGAHKRLDENGNVLPGLDVLDNIYITSVKNGVHTDWQLRDSYFGDIVGNSDHYDAYFATVGNVINTHPSGYDTDNDGMPDAWEVSTFGNLNRTGMDDLDGDGYTDFEEFLHGVDGADDTIFVVADAGNDISICVGESTQLTASGGDNYQWNTGATTASIDVNPNSTTTYTVTAFDAVGENSDTDDVIVTVNELPIANAGVDVETCLGTPITLSANSSDSYLWNTGATSQSIDVNPNVTTTFSVQVTQNGCTSDFDEVIVTVNPLPSIDAGSDVTINFGDSTTLTANGADSYLWSTSETTQSITVNPTIDTTYTVTGTIGTCENTDSVTVFIFGSEVVADAGDDQTICNGLQTTLTATGGAAYQWNTGETTASIVVNPINTTNYTVTAFDSTGTVSDIDDVTVNVTTNPIANAGDDIEICEGSTATLSASGGTSYLWNTGATSQSIDVNPNTTTIYSVEVTQNGCSSDLDEVIVTVSPLPSIDAGSNVTINLGESTTLTASGGDSYLWNTSEDTASITVSPDVTTTYTVTGFLNGCENNSEVTVTIIDTSVTANAGNDVTICEGSQTTLTASGGASYQWNTGATTASIDVNPNSTTTYTVTAFDATGTNSDVDDVTVNVTASPIANAGDDVEICVGSTVTLSASGGTSYLWNTGATSQSIDVNPNTTTIYSVEVTQNGCSSDLDEVIVTVSPLPSIDAGSNVTINLGESTTLTASGGDSYLWNTSEDTASITVSPDVTTTYTVTGFLNGCENNSEVTVTIIDTSVTANAGNDVTICEGSQTTLTASGGASYQWNTGATTASIDVNPNSTTTYTVTAFDATGTNSDVDDVTVNVTASPIANAGNDVEICQGSSFTLTASGGTSYLWNTGATSQSITVNPNTTTTYLVEVTQNNCSSNDEVSVIVNDLPNVNAGSDIIITEGESATLTATGADTYLWSTGATTQTIEVNPLNTTLYSVTGFSNGCEATDEVLVTVEPIVFSASAGEDQSICEGTSTILTASEGDAYLWSTGETTQSITVNPWASETFTVTVFEEDEQAEADVTVFVNLNPNVVIMNGGEVTILEGEFITLSASGANTYEWNNGATQPNIAVSPSTTTTYSVTGYINNCSDEKAVSVNVVKIVEAYAGEDLFICSEEMVTLTANEGANDGEEYLWDNGETTQSINVAPGTDTEYSVLVYNALSSAESTVMVFVNDCDPDPIADEEFDFLIYQDAIADVLKVQISGLDRVDVEQIEIYDITGKIIYREQIQTEENTQSLDKEINSSQFSRGIYIVRLTYDDTEIVKKIPIR